MTATPTPEEAPPNVHHPARDVPKCAPAPSPSHAPSPPSASSSPSKKRRPPPPKPPNRPPVISYLRPIVIMPLRIRTAACFVWSLGSCILALTVLTVTQLNSPSPANCNCPDSSEAGLKPSLDGKSKPHLCLLVPFRDRFDELMEFVPHMNEFLTNQGVSYSTFVLDQVDPYRFNRASLLNVGYLYAAEGRGGPPEGKGESTRGRPRCDYLGLHDVDLLPDQPQLNYSFAALPANSVLHVSAPGLHPKYDYPTFVGGILLLRAADFKRVNGMSNNYWGWGLEDDEFHARLKEAGIAVARPQGITSGKERTFKHVHSPAKRKRDTQKCYNQRDVTRRRDRQTGLDTVGYQLKRARRLAVDGVAVTLLNVWLECDKGRTPWCDCADAPSTEAPVRPLAKDEVNILPKVPKKKKKKKSA